MKRFETETNGEIKLTAPSGQVFPVSPEMLEKIERSSMAQEISNKYGEKRSSTFEVRDRRVKGWLWQDHDLVRKMGKHIGVAAVGVYTALCNHADENGICWPSQDLIAEELDIDTKTLRKWIDVLKERKIISIEKRRDPDGTWDHNVYVLWNTKHWIYPKEGKKAIHREILPMVKSASPSGNITVNHREIFPTKKIHYKKNHYIENSSSKKNTDAVNLTTVSKDTSSSNTTRAPKKRGLEQLIPLTGKHNRVGQFNPIEAREELVLGCANRKELWAKSPINGVIEFYLDQKQLQFHTWSHWEDIITRLVPDAQKLVDLGFNLHAIGNTFQWFGDSEWWNQGGRQWNLKNVAGKIHEVANYQKQSYRV